MIIAGKSMIITLAYTKFNLEQWFSTLAYLWTPTPAFNEKNM